MLTKLYSVLKNEHNIKFILTRRCNQIYIYIYIYMNINTNENKYIT